MKLHDVAVVGGGPVGSQVAYQLAGLGYRVVVLEQKSRWGEPVCCTGIISRDCVRAFTIDESVILRWLNGARIFSPSGKLLNLWRPEPQACVVDRAAFNLALANRAQGRGVEYELTSPVQGIEVGNDRVSLEVARQGGKSSFIEARAAVLATGFGAKLVEKLGLGKASDFVTAAQAEVDTVAIDEVEVYLGQEIAPAFFAWLVPTSPGKALVGLLSRTNPALYLKRL
ncbi:MAG: NAD(P)/FAD-dependent oxidoreductase, partial [bacterium]|nr:NAD(P)/FAD-dependent oxidoreductase [bacterium]